MDVEISSDVFEWLLTRWAGSGENPAGLSDSLQDDRRDLADELAAAMRKAGVSQERTEKALARA